MKIVLTPPTSPARASSSTAAAVAMPTSIVSGAGGGATTGFTASDAELVSHSTNTKTKTTTIPTIAADELPTTTKLVADAVTETLKQSILAGMTPVAASASTTTMSNHKASAAIALDTHANAANDKTTGDATAAKKKDVAADALLEQVIAGNQVTTAASTSSNKTTLAPAILMETNAAAANKATTGATLKKTKAKDETIKPTTAIKNVTKQVANKSEPETGVVKKAVAAKKKTTTTTKAIVPVAAATTDDEALQVVVTMTFLYKLPKEDKDAKAAETTATGDAIVATINATDGDAAAKVGLDAKAAATKDGSVAEVKKLTKEEEEACGRFLSIIMIAAIFFALGAGSVGM